MTRTDLPPSLDERALLATFLDYVRATAIAKCEDLAAEDARKAPLPGSPLMTLSGLISHLRWVEYYWFEVVFLGGQDEGPWTDEDPDREMRIAVDIPPAELLADYRAVTDRYRELVAGADLDAVAVRAVKDGRPVNLRWILLHLIEETARHNGHLDLLRELADGSTGV
ncbi:DinB family protein [Kitasatospora sp. NPDC002040]|uniref:DinB family protein n=1 Tax=Kitasatospora sp. NPDC002040 TaxID=3154661 RepID=UPI003317E034